MVKQRQKSRSDVSHKKFSKHSDSDDEETELFIRNKPQNREIPSVEKIVEEGDTLQSLAIRYHCTIEDLKRLNNIHKENEIFAKRTIRVPHRPFTMALVHVSGRSSPNEPSTSHSLDVDLNSTLIGLANNAKDKEVNDIIFNSQIAQKTLDDWTEELISDEHEDEEVNLLPQQEVPIEVITTKIHCSGVDGGISLKALIFCIVILIFAVPLIYVFYIAEHPEQYHHHIS